MPEPTVHQLRGDCARLERAVRRAARALHLNEDETDQQLADLPGGADPPDTLERHEWWRRKVHLFGLLRYFLALQGGARAAEQADLDFLRVRTYAGEPARVELANGHVVACHPVTFLLAERMMERQRLLGALTHAREALDPYGAAATRLLRRLDRERCWQRAALLWEATFPPGTLDRLPVDAPLAARIVADAFAWLDGANRWDRDFWRTRGLLGRAWAVLDRLAGGALARWAGVPPWWAWTATVHDEVAIVRQHLAANDERVRAFPQLPTAGGPEGWSWSGFLSALAESRSDFARTLLRDHTLVAVLQEAFEGQERARRQQQQLERERKRQRAGQRPPRPRSRRR